MINEIVEDEIISEIIIRICVAIILCYIAYTLLWTPKKNNSAWIACKTCMKILIYVSLKCIILYTCMIYMKFLNGIKICEIK